MNSGVSALNRPCEPRRSVDTKDVCVMLSILCAGIGVVCWMVGFGVLGGYDSLDVGFVLLGGIYLIMAYLLNLISKSQL